MEVKFLQPFDEIDGSRNALQDALRRAFRFFLPQPWHDLRQLAHNVPLHQTMKHLLFDSFAQPNVKIHAAVRTQLHGSDLRIGDGTSQPFAGPAPGRRLHRCQQPSTSHGRPSPFGKPLFAVIIRPPRLRQHGCDLCCPCQGRLAVRGQVVHDNFKTIA